MIIPSQKFFQISFQKAPSDILGCWQILAAYLNEQKSLPKQLRLVQVGQEDDLFTDADGVAAAISARNLKFFTVHTGYTEDSLSFTLSSNLFFCGITGKAKVPIEWGAFIEALAQHVETIGGWQPYWPYRTWQDLRHPNSFNSGAWGPFPPGYRVWHEPDKYGIGPGETLIDKSKNPGHTKVVEGYTIFYPTAEMWLGPHFWQYAQCTKEEALAADFWLETRDTPHYTYFKCWPTPFTRPDGEQGRMQQRLWKLFFNEDCEWPPGSGTICDEPMFGPPELMPDYVPPKTGS